MHGEEQDAGVQGGGRDPAGDLDAGGPWHGEVQDGEVGLVGLDELPGGLAVGGLAQERDVRLASEQGGEPLADDGVVVGEDDA